MTGKSILLLPGAYWQVELAKRILSSGYELTVIDPNRDAPCVPLAKEYFQADVLDWDRVRQFCESHDFEAVLSDECDVVMPVIAKIGQLKRISGILTLDCANLYTNKYQMRQRCAKMNVPCPVYRLCSTIDEAKDFYHSLNGTMVIKPIDNNASRGVFVIRNEAELVTKFSESIKYSHREKKILAEEYIDGVEFTVDGICTPSGHYTLAISEKKHFVHNPSVASELLFTHTNPKFDYDLLKLTNDRFVNGSGLEFGLTHAEYKFKNGKFYQMEIAARGGGTMISSVIAPFMSGVDSYGYLINHALHRPFNTSITISHSYTKRAAVLKFFDVPSVNGGCVRKIKGIDFLSSQPEILHYNIRFHEGDIIRPSTTDSDRIGYYIACCESFADLKELMHKVDEAFKIICY